MSETLLAAFRRAASTVPAYRQLLDEHGVEPTAIVDRDRFAALCPILTKANTFDRFPIDQLCAEGTLQDLADVLTSSGHGGRFSFGLSTRAQQAEAAAAIDQALDAAFEVRTRRTLAINCLPMGVTFSSKAMTVATTSVREDMAVALIKTFGSHYDQVVLVSDPLFMRRLLDHADEQGIDWRSYRVRVVLGEETFGEQFRSYVAGRLGLDIDGDDAGAIISSFGVGELGLHLCFETPSTIAVRRAAHRDPLLARELFGDCPVLPTVLAYDERRTLIEALGLDQAGYGRMTVSMLDPTLPMPLLRYQTGDVVRWLDPSRIILALWRRGVKVAGPLPPMLALAGREKERLPNRSYVGAYKDALYSDRRIADRLTGAFRVVPVEAGFVIVHVQLVPGATVEADFADRVRSVLGIRAQAGQVIVSTYEDFPYGMGLDYERKFAYYVPGEALAAV
jgi:phenylacetate-coenzyme A ligase PaaK-like adenylate-forming protein